MMKEFPPTYKNLNQQKFELDQFWIQPIRFKSHQEIMNWRNDQIKFLRQKEKLTKPDQVQYFDTVIRKLYEVKQPDQLLYNFYHEQSLIGYGGLVHIDWQNRNAEISFILDTRLNNVESYLEKFPVFLRLIENVASELKFHKIFTYGYDIAAYRFEPLEKLGYQLEARLIDHISIENDLYDVRIYSKFI